MVGGAIGATLGAALPPKTPNTTSQETARRIVSEKLEGTSIAEAKAVSDKLKNAPAGSNISLADEIQDGSLGNIVGTLSQAEGVGPMIRDKAKPILDKARERLKTGVVS